MKQLNCRSATQLFRCKTNPNGSDSYQTKSTDPFSQLSNFYKLHAPYSNAIKGGSGFTQQDHYKSRLTKTYSLKAGVYAGLGDIFSKATNINLVKARPKAIPVTAGNITIDHILDERIRKLGIEGRSRII